MASITSRSYKASPPQGDQMGYVRPSRLLLEFYRKKIGEYENEHDRLMKMLEGYCKSHQEQHQLDWEIRQREEEISELQKALSDMQVFLFQEREQVLKLYSENDTYKARDMENKRTVQQLLALRGSAVDGEVSYFFKEPPEQPIIADKTSFKESHNLRLDGKQRMREVSAHPPLPNRLKELEKPDQVTLKLQLEALQSQLADQERWGKEYLEALDEDKRIKAEEEEKRRERDLEKLKIITEKLHKTQDLLYESTQSTLRLRNDWNEKSDSWLRERNSLLLELDKCRGRLNVNRQQEPDLSVTQRDSSTNNLLTVDTTVRYKLEAKKLRAELEDTTKMSEMYREQVISLEDDIAAYKEKEHIKTDVYQDKMENMSKRYQIMKTRYEDLEKRRNFEVEGFKNDIKSLRRQLKDMEKQLYKATMQFGERIASRDADLVVLHEVKKTSGRSKRLQGQLKGIKEQVYTLEDDMRHL